jgi:mRNA interferase MazF
MPKRGEVWYANLDPVKGDEIKKTRPVVVISSDSIVGLRNKIIVPITSWKAEYSSLYWMIGIKPSRGNGLTKDSVAAASQVRTISIDRFIRKIGRLPEAKIREVVAAVALCIEYV